MNRTFRTFVVTVITEVEYVSGTSDGQDENSSVISLRNSRRQPTICRCGRCRASASRSLLAE